MTGCHVAGDFYYLSTLLVCAFVLLFASFLFVYSRKYRVVISVYLFMMHVV